MSIIGRKIEKRKKKEKKSLIRVLYCTAMHHERRVTIFERLVLLAYVWSRSCFIIGNICWCCFFHGGVKVNQRKPYCNFNDMWSKILFRNYYYYLYKQTNLLEEQ